MGFEELHQLSHDLRDLEHKMAEATGEALDKVLEKYQNVQHEFDIAGGYAWQHKMEAALLGVGLGRETWEQKVGRPFRRAALAAGASPSCCSPSRICSCWTSRPITWTWRRSNGSKSTWRISTARSSSSPTTASCSTAWPRRIVWLNRAKIDSYPGNYSAYVEQRELHETTQQRAYELQQKDIEKQQEFIRRFKAGQRSKEAKGREKRLERLLESGDVVQRVATQQRINLSLNTDQRAGDRVLQVRELHKAVRRTASSGRTISIEIARGERIGIIGPNGSGKTTLLKVLMDSEPATAGDVKWGANLSIGYYDQRLDMLKPHHTLMDAIQDGRTLTDKAARDVLGLMLFGNDDLPKTIEMLSGGEKARVRLAQLLVDKPNVLVLDEPTNHLDIASREALEAALGTVRGHDPLRKPRPLFPGPGRRAALGSDAAGHDRFRRQLLGLGGETDRR